MRVLLRMLVSLTLLLPCVGWSASPFVSDNFLRLTAGEQINAPFTLDGGTMTNETYKGLVEVIVSGTGYSLGFNENDAFYCSRAIDTRCLTPGVVLDDTFYQLNIGMDGQPFSWGEANNIDRYIIFIDNLGPVERGTRPFYDGETHTYRFVIELPLEGPSKLVFGVSDIMFGDNGGSYDLQLFQVAAIPEPSSLVLTLLGLVLMAFLCRTRAST